jgi:hypothetical protein
MRLLCLVLAVVSASAADFDISDPGFWTKTYAIPRSYCDRRISLISSRPEKLIKAASPCEFSVQNGLAGSQCRLSRAESDRVVEALRRMGTLTAYSQTCDPPPEYQELTYKRDNLRREWGEVKLSSAVAPAISGLMAAQFATLDQLIAARQSALEAILTILISTSDAATPAGTVFFPSGDRMRAHKAITRTAQYRIDGPPGASRFNIDPSAGAATPSVAWARRQRAACEQVESIIVEYQKTGRPEDDQILHAASRLGKAYAEQACARLNDGALATVIFSSRSEKDIRKALTSLPGLRSWRAWPAGDDGVVPDDRRLDMLSSELTAQRKALERAPHIRGLIGAEIERVRENAERLRPLRDGRLVLIRFAQ